MTRKNVAIARILKKGGIGILPTDTLYGLVGSALKPETVKRIYRVRRRNPKKPFIILIGSLADFKKFGIRLNPLIKKICERFWPGKVSIILPCPSKKFFYLHRGTKSLAFRLLKPIWLRKLLTKTGPLVAPSANLEGLLPAESIKAAKKYFSDKIDFYRAGKTSNQPSTLIEIKKGKIMVRREGAVKINN